MRQKQHWQSDQGCSLVDTTDPAHSAAISRGRASHGLRGASGALLEALQSAALVEMLEMQMIFRPWGHEADTDPE